MEKQEIINKAKKVAKVTGLDFPVSVRVHNDGNSFLITDLNEGILTDRDFTETARISNPFAKSGHRNETFTPEEVELQNNYKGLVACWVS